MERIHTSPWKFPLRHSPCIKRRVFWIPRSPDSISVISRGIFTPISLFVLEAAAWSLKQLNLLGSSATGPGWKIIRFSSTEKTGQNPIPSFSIPRDIFVVWIWKYFTKLHFLEISLRFPEIRIPYFQPYQKSLYFEKKKLQKRIKNAHSWMAKSSTVDLHYKNMDSNTKSISLMVYPPHPATVAKFRFLGIPYYKVS